MHQIMISAVHIKTQGVDTPFQYYAYLLLISPDLLLVPSCTLWVARLTIVEHRSKLTVFVLPGNIQSSMMPSWFLTRWPQLHIIITSHSIWQNTIGHCPVPFLSPMQPCRQTICPSAVDERKKTKAREREKKKKKPGGGGASPAFARESSWTPSTWNCRNTKLGTLGCQ